MTVIKENLKRIWDCLVTKAPEITSLLQPGLKPEEIDEITKDLPFKLPEEVYEIYQWRNGLLKGVGLSGWKFGESFIGFDSLQATIQHVKKIIIAGQPTYFIIILSLAHENGGDFFTVPIGREISSVIHLNDEDYFLESVDYQTEFVPKLNSNLIESVNTSAKSTLKDDLFERRKAYNNLRNFIAEIADCCEQGFNRLEINEYGYISVYLNQEKCNLIHYRHRAAKKNIYCLTLEQEGQLSEKKQSWLDVINTPLNHQKAAKIIRELYAYAGEEIPDVVFVPSFYTAHLGILKNSDFLEQIQNNYLAEKLKSLYWDLLLIPFDYLLAQPVITSVLTSLKSELSDSLNKLIEDDLRLEIKDFFQYEVSPIFQKVIKLLYSAIKYDLKDTLGDNFIEVHLKYKYILGNEDFISSAALFEFAHLLGVKFDEQKLNLFVSYCREIWCIIPFDKTIIVCEKPQITWRENFFPNSIQQPDITFPDGYSI
ncbi:MAG: SMI1/KNR4 family protein [Nostoc sp.]|uniref:SMI1/KNR4 family protein n=1 Tax=Nostoc sp. TaxID=1180 RepID=UPI002FF5426F